MCDYNIDDNNSNASAVQSEWEKSVQRLKIANRDTVILKPTENIHMQQHRYKWTTEKKMQKGSNGTWLTVRCADKAWQNFFFYFWNSLNTNKNGSFSIIIVYAMLICAILWAMST